MINLPKNIDYTLYHNTSGMSTKHFGPQAWGFLFTSILGRYPVKIDNKNKEHIKIARAYHDILTNLKITLPCIYCRKSYTQFLKELPIKPFLVGRIELFYWLYLMKDKVNKKLINQEKKLYKNKKKKLQNLYKTNKINREEYENNLYKLKLKIFKTIPSPPFEDVLNQYEKLRANCTKKLKTCSIKKN
jgi:hypothetical protein